MDDEQMLPPRREHLVVGYTRASYEAFLEMDEYESFCDRARAARQMGSLLQSTKMWDNASHALAAALKHRLHELALRQQEYALFKNALLYDEKLKLKLVMGYCERRIQRIQHFEQDFTRIKGAIAHLDHKILQHDADAEAWLAKEKEEDLENKMNANRGRAQIIVFGSGWDCDKRSGSHNRGPVIHNHATYYAQLLRKCQYEHKKYVSWGDEKQEQKKQLLASWEKKRRKYKIWSEKCRPYDEEARAVAEGKVSTRDRSRSRQSSSQPPPPSPRRYAESPMPSFVSAQDRVHGLRRMRAPEIPVPERRRGSTSTSLAPPAQPTPILPNNHVRTTAGRTTSRASAGPSHPFLPGTRQASVASTTTSRASSPSGGGSPERDNWNTSFDAALNQLNDDPDFAAATQGVSSLALGGKGKGKGKEVQSGSSSSILGSDDINDSGYSSDPSIATGPRQPGDIGWLTGDNERRATSSHKSWSEAFETVGREKSRAKDKGKGKGREMPTVKEEEQDDPTYGWEYDFAKEADALGDEMRPEVTIDYGDDLMIL